MPNRTSLLRPLGVLLMAGLVLSGAAEARTGPPWGRGESRGEDLAIRLVTFSPGEDIPSWWGHGALVVEDKAHGQARLYNYGMFDFDEKMLARFAMGRLEFWVGEAPVNGTYRAYASLDRDVFIQELNLTPEARVKLARALADNVLPENRNYLYAHYSDNCTTRLRDMIDLGVDGQFHQALSGPGRMTLRDHTRRYTSVNPPMSVLLDYFMNNSIDHPITRWDESFLPDELRDQVAGFHYRQADGAQAPLVATAYSYYQSSRPQAPEQPPKYGLWLLLLGTVLGAIPLGLQAWGGLQRTATRVGLGVYNLILGVGFGLPGLVLTFFWTCTNHTVTYHNENLFLANPLTFLAAPLGVALARGWPKAAPALRAVWYCLAVTGSMALLAKALPAVFDQDNWRLIALLLPTSLGMAASWALEKKRAPSLRTAVISAT